MTRIFNRKRQKPRRQQLRNSATSAERLLWHYLRSKQIWGVKFRRQHGIGPFIMDFFSHECMLAVEVDGATHWTEEEIVHDKRREAFISRHNIMTLRFTNEDIYMNMEGVLTRIEEVALARRSKPNFGAVDHPTLPSPQ